METLQRTANRGSLSTGYDIDNSLKLESDNSEYLDNRHHSAGNRRTWTLSFWIKRTELGTTQKPYDSGNAAGGAMFYSTYDTIAVENSDLWLVTNRVFRDTSAWLHIVLLNDSTQSTASNRAKLWINGVQETSFSSETYMPQNQEGNINSATSVSIGGGGGAHVNGYMAEFFFVDGQALAPTDFGEYDSDSGIWIPKEYEGTLSGTSLKLDFSDSSALWTDSSGLSGNGTAMSGNNITSADQATDTPTNNFATMTEAWAYASQLEVRWGGTLTTTNTAAWSGAKSTIGVNKGKWYWEIRWNDTISTYTGIQTQGEDNISASGSAAHSRNTSLSIGAGSKYRTYINGTDTLYTSQPSGNISTGEVTGFALDLDSGTKTLKLIRSGSVVQTYTLTDSLATEYVFPFCSTYAQTLVWNLGGFFHYTLSSAETDANGLGSFEFSPTIGGVNYYALCTKNLAEYG